MATAWPLPEIGGRLGIGTARLIVGAAGLLASVGSPLIAQAAFLGGNITSDSLGRHPLVGSRVSIPVLQRTTTANFAGEYRFERLVPGRYIVVVQASGFRDVGDSVTVSATGDTFHDFVLLAKAIVLDSVVATAPSPARKYYSQVLRDFEQRRTSGQGGHFLSEDELRQNEARKFSDLLRSDIPAMTLVPGPASASYATSGRTVSSPPSNTVRSGRAVLKPPAGVPAACYATVYLDGVLLYDVQQTPAARPPNIDDYNVSHLAGVEFYAGAATAPPGFKDSGCGLLLLWTREK